jgi:formylglycine-generating enzyme required for sulfatase activity
MAVVRPTPRRTGQFSRINHEEVHYGTHNGAFNNNEQNVRCAVRNHNNPHNRNRNNGFRVVVAAHSSPEHSGSPEMSSG